MTAARPGHVDPPRLLHGRYELAEAIAAGGMATIYLARQLGAVGFSRVVAVKRLHAHYASEPEFMSMFLDEARLAARVRHRHVVEMLDVVHEGSETLIVLEYIDGESLAGLLALLRAAGQRMPLDVGVAVVASACRGLHAAHQARGADGAALGIVHRDVSPQNVLVGTDGVARVTDFGVALANGRLSQTRAGQVKGKLAYMAPEQLSRDEVTFASDIYAAGVVLWEVCAGRRAYEVASEGALYARVLSGSIPSLADVAPWVPVSLARVVERALKREPAQRFVSAKEMADALEEAKSPASASQLAEFVEQHARDALRERRAIAARLDPGAWSCSEAAAGSSAAALSGMVQSAPPSQAPAASHPVPSSRRQSPASDDTQGRITHTFTSVDPHAGRARSGVKALALALALLGAAAAGVCGAWLVLRRPAPAESSRFALRWSQAEAIPSPVASAPVAPSAAVAEPEPSLAPPELAPSPSAVMPDRMASPLNTAATLPSQRPAASPASSSIKPPCDPPYFIDANGIRRVKRDCF